MAEGKVIITHPESWEPEQLDSLLAALGNVGLASLIEVRPADVSLYDPRRVTTMVDPITRRDVPVITMEKVREYQHKTGADKALSTVVGALFRDVTEYGKHTWLSDYFLLDRRTTADAPYRPLGLKAESARELILNHQADLLRVYQVGKHGLAALAEYCRDLQPFEATAN